MIRAIRKEDIDTVADIWLATNITTHNFIIPQYWLNNFEPVKKMLSQAEIYVFEEENNIQAFIGLTNDYISGIFVFSEFQSRGIGKRLLDFVKTIRKKLSLDVYQKNTRAVKFYQREGFEIQSKNTDVNTNEEEYTMVWELQPDLSGTSQSAGQERQNAQHIV